MMLKLFKENIRIAFGSIKTQLLRTILTVLIIAIGITALVGILTVVTALENTISTNFASMGANTFNINQYENNLKNRGSNEREIVNPIISYPEAVASSIFKIVFVLVNIEGIGSHRSKIGRNCIFKCCYDR